MGGRGTGRAPGLSLLGPRENFGFPFSSLWRNPWKEGRVTKEQESGKGRAELRSGRKGLGEQALGSQGPQACVDPLYTDHHSHSLVSHPLPYSGPAWLSPASIPSHPACHPSFLTRLLWILLQPHLPVHLRRCCGALAHVPNPTACQLSPLGQ